MEHSFSSTPLSKMNHRLFLPLLLGALLLASCQNDELAVRQCAQSYLDAVGNFRIEEAEPYATDETIATYLHYVEEVIMPNLMPEVIASSTPATSVIDDIAFTSYTTATVRFTKTSPKDTQTATLDLVKRNNQWKVHFIPEIPAILTPRRDDLTQKIPPKITLP